MTWHNSGYDGLKAEEDRIASLAQPDRLWMPSETDREVLFIDDVPFCIREHQVKIDGSFKNWFTCLRDVEEDVVCCEKLGARSPYYVGYYTVVDFHEYVDKQGKKHKYEVKLLPAKFTSLKMLKAKKESRTKLAGSVFKTTRYGDKSPSIGDEFEFQRELAPEKLDELFAYATFRGKKLTELWAKATDPEKVKRVARVFQADVKDGQLVPKLVPFNYFEVLKPLPPKDLKLAIKGAAVGGFKNETPEGGSTPTTGEEEVPF